MRVGVLARHLADPGLRQGVHDRVRDAVEALGGLGFDVREVDVDELDVADEALGAIVLYEAWHAHRTRYEAEADHYGDGTRALLELGAKISDDDYRAALADRDRVTAGFERALAEVDVLAGPTVAYVAPPRIRRSGLPTATWRPGSPAPTTSPACRRCPCRAGRQRTACPPGSSSPRRAGEDAFLLSVAAAYEEVRMRLHDMNWMQVEEYLRTDDRVVLPLGSTEQHGYLSLGVDVILSERVSVEAAEPLGVPVLPRCRTA